MTGAAAPGSAGAGPAATEPVLVLDGVRLPAPGRRGGVGSLSVELAPEEAVAVSGSTFSGAVLVRACLGLARAPSGRIRVMGQDVGDLAEGELARLREEVGAVLTPHGLVANLTIRDNLLLPLIFRHGDPDEDSASRVEEVLAALEMGGLGDERPATLGSGAAERVAVARALVRRPRLLLMENLDAALTAVEIREVMDFCRRDERAILITATETNSAACSCCDRVVELSSGAAP